VTGMALLRQPGGVEGVCLLEGDHRAANTYASAARNLATVAGIANDKSAAADGRPTQIIEPADPEAILQRLKQLGVVIDPGEPAVDAEVVND
jgi:hypothetical protein